MHLRLSLGFILACILSCNTKNVDKTNGKVAGKDGSPISYISCGDGDTTLLFLHGWCINKEYWEPQLKHFCPRYKVVAIDLPGFGQSGKTRSDWNFDHYADDVHTVITELKLKNVILLGHSMSGDIILKVDNKFPDDVIAIAGVDNLHEPGYPMTAKDQLETDSFFYNMSRRFDTAVTAMARGLFHITTDSAIVRRVMNDVLNCDTTIAVAVLKAMMDKWQQEKQMMQTLSHKLYLINSDAKPVKSDYLNRYCRHGFKLFTVPATGHYPMIEKPVDFNAALEQLIKDL